MKLVAKLRARQKFDRLFEEAADRIEELEKALEPFTNIVTTTLPPQTRVSPKTTAEQLYNAHKVLNR